MGEPAPTGAVDNPAGNPPTFLPPSGRGSRLTLFMALNARLAAR